MTRRRRVLLSRPIEKLSIQQFLAQATGHFPEIERIQKMKKKIYPSIESKREFFSGRTKWVKGRLLSKSIKTMSRREKVIVARQLGSIVGFMQKNGIIHGDFHAANMKVVRVKGKPRVIIFDNETIGLQKESRDYFKERRRLVRFFNTGELSPTHDLDILKDAWIGKAFDSKLRKIFLEAYEKELLRNPMTFRGRDITKRTKLPLVTDVK